MKYPSLVVSALASAVLLAAGCAGTRSAKKTVAVPSTGPAASATDAAGLEDREPDVRDLATDRLAAVSTISFTVLAPLAD